MIAKLYAKTYRRYQIDNKNGILLSWIATQNFIKQPHKTHKFKEN